MQMNQKEKSGWLINIESEYLQLSLRLLRIPAQSLIHIVERIIRLCESNLGCNDGEKEEKMISVHFVGWLSLCNAWVYVLIMLALVLLRSTALIFHMHHALVSSSSKSPHCFIVPWKVVIVACAAINIIDLASCRISAIRSVAPHKMMQEYTWKYVSTLLIHLVRGPKAKEGNNEDAHRKSFIIQQSKFISSSRRNTFQTPDTIESVFVQLFPLPVLGSCSLFAHHYSLSTVGSGTDVRVLHALTTWSLKSCSVPPWSSSSPTQRSFQLAPPRW